MKCDERCIKSDWCNDHVAPKFDGWKDINVDGLPEDGSYVFIGFEFGVGIALFKDGCWDTVGANRKHYIFTEKEKLHTSCVPNYWKPLFDPPGDYKCAGS